MLSTLTTASWTASFSPVEQESAITSLENGKIIYLPQLPFQLDSSEQLLLTSEILDGNCKNISFNPQTQTLKGTSQVKYSLLVANMMDRFFKDSRRLVETLLPHYKDGLLNGRTSFRPVEVVGRKTSLLKDDTRLHVDAFAATPNHGKRILRVFSNVNPSDQYRLWHLGEPFEEVIAQFLPKLKKPIVGSRALLSLLKVTKSYRSLYDHYMLQLHNEMKKSDAYQKRVNKIAVPFLAGSTWIVTTDSVSHAALSGQFLLEQTFYLPVDAMKSPEKSPLRVLEKALNTSLIEQHSY